MPSQTVAFIARRSTQISSTGFAAIVLVLFVHADNLQVNFKDHSVVTDSVVVRFLEMAISSGLASAAVPWFFAVSGLLFFYDLSGAGSGDSSWFVDKARRRLQSLVLPYLLWSVFYFVVVSLLKMPAAATHFFKSGAVDFSPGAVLYKVLVSPVPYQLWFVRDLIVYTAISPLLLLLLRHAGKWLVLLLAVIWIGHVDLRIVSPEGLLFFCIGGWMALTPAAISFLDRPGTGRLWLAAWVLLALAVGACSVLWDPLPPLVRELAVLAGLMALWFGYRTWATRLQNVLARLAPFTFFLYAAHEPILTIFKKLIFVFLGASASTHIYAYFGAPLITALVLISVGSVTREKVPRLFGILTGWRGVRPDTQRSLQRAPIM